MVEENELTPEEKLLAVIQKGESDSGTSNATASPMTLSDESDSQIQPRASQPPMSVGLRTVNQLLALAAVALLALSGYEIYRNLPQPDKQYSPAEIDLQASGTLVMASLSDTLDMFAQRRITGKMPKTEVDPAPGPNPETAGWRAYIRDHFKFMGTSVVQRQMSSGGAEDVHEAIIMDNKAKKMQFLNAGDVISVNKVDVRVDTIDEDKVVFVSGDASLTVTGSGAE